MELPNYIEKESWQGYLAMRKAIKRPMTERAQKMALNMLERLRNEGEDVNLVLQQSEFKSWQGLFPVGDDFLDAMGIKKPKKPNQAVLRMVDRDWADG